MPKISLAVMENRVREYKKDLPRSIVRKVAKIALKRFELFTYEPTEQEVLELFVAIPYMDPTGEAAVRNAGRLMRYKNPDSFYSASCQ